jgi:hypothetical protein
MFCVSPTALSVLLHFSWALVLGGPDLQNHTLLLLGNKRQVVELQKSCAQGVVWMQFTHFQPLSFQDCDREHPGRRLFMMGEHCVDCPGRPIRHV